MNYKSVPVATANNSELDWALAILLGKAEREAVHAKDTDVEGKPLPLALYETSDLVHGGELFDVRVTSITVTSFAIRDGATLPTITFRGHDGREGRGVAGMFYKDQTEAYLRAKAALRGYALDFRPTSSWGDCGPLLQDYRLLFRETEGGAYAARFALGKDGRPEGVGACHRIAAARCVLLSEVGPSIEVPHDLDARRARWTR